MTEKRQTSQGYIIRILQHFATKLWNITNFVMLFQAVMKAVIVQTCLDQNFTQKGKGPFNKKRFERNTKTLHTNEVVKSFETQLHVFIYKTSISSKLV
jgi:hypothetical protein